MVGLAAHNVFGDITSTVCSGDDTNTVCSAETKILVSAVCHLPSLIQPSCCCLLPRIGRPISMTMRIGIGFVFQIIALISAAIIEMARYRVVRNVGLVDAFKAAGPNADPLDPKYTEAIR